MKKFILSTILITVLCTSFFSIFIIPSTSGATLFSDGFESGDFSVWTNEGAVHEGVGEYSVESDNPTEGSYNSYFKLIERDNCNRYSIILPVHKTFSIQATY